MKIKNMAWIVASCSMVLLAARAYGFEVEPTLLADPLRKQFYADLNKRQLIRGPILTRDNFWGRSCGPRQSGSLLQHTVGEKVWCAQHDNDDREWLVQQDDDNADGVRTMVLEGVNGGYFWDTYVTLTIKQSQSTKNFIESLKRGDKLVVCEGNLYEIEDCNKLKLLAQQDPTFQTDLTGARREFFDLLRADIDAGHEAVTCRRPTRLGWATIVSVPLITLHWWLKARAAR